MGNPEVKAKPDAAEVQAILATLSPEKRAKLETLMKSAEGKSRRMSDEELLTEYPHIIKDGIDGKTSVWDPNAKKVVVLIRCGIPGCKETRKVFSSDAFQAKTCITHKKEQRKAARVARKAEADALMEEGRKALAAKAEETS